MMHFQFSILALVGLMIFAATGAKADSITPEESMIAAVNHCNLQDLEAVFQNYHPNVNYIDERGESALHIVNKFSICEGSNALKFEILKSLLGHGANVNLYNAGRETPLLALLEGSADIGYKRPATELLLRKGADPNQSGGHGERPVTVVGCSGQGRLILDLLLKAGGNINSQNVATGATMIFYRGWRPTESDAAAYVDCLAYFKQNGGDFEIKDASGDTAFTFALKNIEAGNPDFKPVAAILDALLARGANVNFVNTDGDSGLLILAKFAAGQSHDAYNATRVLFDVFVEHKADLNQRDRNGKTALAILKEGKQMSLAKFLFAYGAKD